MREAPSPARGAGSLRNQLIKFREFGTATRQIETQSATFGGAPLAVPTFVNEFWTARQRAANNLHEISYRACFKPQLPRFFIERLTRAGDVVYDPFMGRGTTLLEAALLGRVLQGCDVNPLCRLLVAPRLNPPSLDAIEHRLQQIDFSDADEHPKELLTFYHAETLREICALKKYLLGRQASRRWDALDGWIAMVGLNRLTGHSPGFFSVYTLPPNQATSVKAQQRINQKRRQVPPRRAVPAIIARKSRVLLMDCDTDPRAAWRKLGSRALLLTGEACCT